VLWITFSQLHVTKDIFYNCRHLCFLFCRCCKVNVGVIVIFRYPWWAYHEQIKLKLFCQKLNYFTLRVLKGWWIILIFTRPVFLFKNLVSVCGMLIIRWKSQADLCSILCCDISVYLNYLYFVHCFLRIIMSRWFLFLLVQ